MRLPSKKRAPKRRKNPPMGANDPALKAALRDAVAYLGRMPKMGRR
jgi:hypothetical protein